MSNVIPAIEIAAYLLVLIFGTHFIRTIAFNRYEAVTYECSAVSVLLSLLLLWKYGPTPRLLGLFFLLLALFVGVAYAQWHFYVKLQTIILKIFHVKTKYLKKHHMDADVNESLYTMASVAIMPSFSRFIEESKLFNNPGGFIGLVKSIMKRQRFQKKKYQMRECFAENVNMIGPCKPAIDKMMNDVNGEVIPGAVHPNDLALDYPDEKKGLIAFDVLGFGSMVIIYLVLVRIHFHPIAAREVTSPMATAAIMLLCAILFTVISHVLRHYAFARYESIFYEFAFTSLVIAAHRVIMGAISGETVLTSQYVILGVIFAFFLALSVINKRVDKSFHNKVNDLYQKILLAIPIQSETGRIQKHFLKNLKLISEWALVPFPGKPKKITRQSRNVNKKDMKTLTESISAGKKLSLEDKLFLFHHANHKKTEMADLVERLIKKLVPECGKMVSKENLLLAGKIRLELLIAGVGLLSFAITFACIGMELL